MNEENAKMLVSHFPELYSEHFYFECLDGWFPLIYSLSAELAVEIRELRKDPEIAQSMQEYGQFRIRQVKEKFGKLRVYMELSTANMESKIYECEEKSASICEMCGKPKDMYGHMHRACCRGI